MHFLSTFLTTNWMARTRDFLSEDSSGRRTLISTVSFTLSQVLRIASSLIMTRILVPEMFGIMAVVNAVQIMVALISDLGVRQLIIQSDRGSDPKFLNTAWTLEIVLGIATWLLCVLISLVLISATSLGLLTPSSTLGSPILPAVLVVSTFASFILGFRSTKSFTVIRDGRLGAISIIDFVSQVISLIAMIVLGLLYGSIWSLVLSTLLSAVMTVILTHLCLPGIANRLHWDRTAFAEIYTKGRWLILSSFIQAFSTNIDRFVMAAFVLPAFMGFYSLALNLYMLIELLGGKLIMDVAYPRLCEAVRKGESVRSCLVASRLPIDALFLFASGFIFVTAPSLIALVYDSRYAQAGEILQILSIGLIFGRFAIHPFAYLALGSPHLMATINAIRLVGAFALIVGGRAIGGDTGAILGVALSSAWVMLSVFWFNRRFGLNDWRYEASVLCIWPFGYVAGLVGDVILRWLMGT